MSKCCRCPNIGHVGQMRSEDVRENKGLPIGGIGDLGENLRDALSAAWVPTYMYVTNGYGNADDFLYNRAKPSKPRLRNS